jgi:lysophospholipase
MSPVPAPYFDAIAHGPEGSSAYWVEATDGIRLRVGVFPTQKQARGTILLFPGRTEYIEKYGKTAKAFADLGYTTVAIAWRGQGIADRLLNDGRIGHVESFDDYQTDVTAVMALVDELDLPGPRHLIGHSMGGCIGLRALYNGLDVVSCAFTGPMWGIRLSAPLRPAAWAIGAMTTKTGFGHKLSPGTTYESYLLAEPFDDNMLTKDRHMWDYMRDQVAEQPGLQLGGPSLQWLFEALLETRTLDHKASPSQPCLCYLGTNERIVDVDRIQTRMQRWSNGKLEMIEHGEHEVLMDNAQIRDQIAQQMVDHFDRAAGLAA